MLLYLYWCSLICLKPGNPAGQDWENRAIGKWSQPHRKGTFSCSLVNISAMIFMSSNSLLLAASGEFSWALSQRTRTETGFTKWAEGMWGMHGLSIIAIVFSVYACILLGIQFCLSQISLETSNKALLDLQEKYQVAITTLKEKELIISKMLFSGKRQLRNWWENFVSFFIFELLVTNVCSYNRKSFNWTCKGVTNWFAECIRGNKFSIWKIR